MKTAILAFSLLSTAAAANLANASPEAAVAHLKCQIDNVVIPDPAKAIQPMNRVPFQAADYTEYNGNLVAVTTFGSTRSNTRQLIQLYVNGQVSEIRVEEAKRGFSFSHSVPDGIRLQCWFE